MILDWMLHLYWLAFTATLEYKNKHLSHSAVKPVTYNNDLPGKICPPVHSGTNAMGVTNTVLNLRPAPRDRIHILTLSIRPRACG